MRQWFVPTRIMCRKHLLGEHVEHHMFVGSINKGIDVCTYVRTKLLIPRLLTTRHSYLVQEMIRRRHRHDSPLPLIQAKRGEMNWGIPNWRIMDNVAELHRRCAECRILISQAGDLSKEIQEIEDCIRTLFIRQE